jgi:hypothetical protein
MRFALLMFDPEGYWETVGEEEMAAALAEHEAFGRYLRDLGVPFSGVALRPSMEARTLRPSGDPAAPPPLASDGPYVALREDLAGFYLVECADIDEAEYIAGHCPMGAGIEIRPIWDPPS